MPILIITIGSLAALWFGKQVADQAGEAVGTEVGKAVHPLILMGAGLVAFVVVNKVLSKGV